MPIPFDETELLNEETPDNLKDDDIDNALDNSKQATDDDGKEDEEKTGEHKEGDTEADNDELDAAEEGIETQKTNLKEIADALRQRNEALEDPLKDIDDDWEPKSYKELLEIQGKISEKKYAELELKKEEDALNRLKEQENARTEIETQWKTEMDKLVGEGRLPKIKNDKSDTDEGINARNEVFKYMIAHNKKVNTEGKGYHITSFEHALDLMDRDSLLKEKAEFEKKQEELKKKRGGMVGGNSGTQGNSKSFGYVKGQSMDDILANELMESLERDGYAR